MFDFVFFMTMYISKLNYWPLTLCSEGEWNCICFDSKILYSSSLSFSRAINKGCLPFGVNSIECPLFSSSTSTVYQFNVISPSRSFFTLEFSAVVISLILIGDY
jgi:hypothetical protein